MARKDSRTDDRRIGVLAFVFVNSVPSETGFLVSFQIGESMPDWFPSKGFPNREQRVVG